MGWNVEYTDEFGEWWNGLNEGQQDDTAAVVGLLEARGPSLPFPHSLHTKTFAPYVNAIHKEYRKRIADRLGPLEPSCRHHKQNERPLSCCKHSLIQNECGWDENHLTMNLCTNRRMTQYK